MLYRLFFNIIFLKKVRLLLTRKVIRCIIFCVISLLIKLITQQRMKLELNKGIIYIILVPEKKILREIS
jgi:hypothetical protein